MDERYGPLKGAAVRKSFSFWKVVYSCRRASVSSHASFTTASPSSRDATSEYRSAFASAFVRKPPPLLPSTHDSGAVPFSSRTAAPSPRHSAESCTSTGTPAAILYTRPVPDGLSIAIPLSAAPPTSPLCTAYTYGTPPRFVQYAWCRPPHSYTSDTNASAPSQSPAARAAA